MFQSTPVIADGRAGLVTDVLMGALVFQSTPVIADGRAYVTVSVLHNPTGVSIHARHR